VKLSGKRDTSAASVLAHVWCTLFDCTDKPMEDVVSTVIWLWIKASF